MLDLKGLFAPHPLPTGNIMEALRYWANVAPNKVAFYYTDGETDSDQSLTYAELDHAARAVAVRILENHKPGERGLLLYPPTMEFVIGFFGCLYAGCVAVPAYPPRRSRKGARIQGIAQDCRAQFALTTNDTVAQILKDEGMKAETESMRLIGTDSVDRSMAIQYHEMPVNPESLAVLQYTSGSTGQPKGVMLTHDNLLKNCEMIAQLFQNNHEKRGVSWLPMYHDMGLVGGVLSPVYMSATMTLMSPMSFMQRPIRWLKTISKYKATTSGGPNFAYQLCIDKVTEEELSELDLSSWEVAFNGAEPVRASTLEMFTQKFSKCGFSNRSHFPCYGMAETTLIVTGGPFQHPPVIRTFDSRKLDARIVTPVAPDSPEARGMVGCGRATDNEKVLIVDSETKKSLGDELIGEIWVQSPSVGRGYWEKEELTKESFQAMTADGQGPFLRTGDLGFWSQNQLYVAGRVKDLIIVRGVNRYPQDIEETVEQCHESISSSAAAAFADDSGPRERLIIAVEVQRSLEADWGPVVQAIRRAVTQVHELPPDGVVLVRHGSLPRTSSGKIQRHACLRGFRENSFRVIHQWLSWEEELPGQAPMIAAATVDDLKSGFQRNTGTKKTHSLGLERPIGFGLQGILASMRD
ncbi:MAG: fatty acyl-AMP ligase [Pirellula sp.]|nr:fatty acyl-AMP ligase [Pirellula sp.]